MGQAWAALQPPKEPIVLTPLPDTVYVTNTGDKYHAGGCRFLKKSRIPIERKEAQRLGKAACKVCKP